MDVIHKSKKKQKTKKLLNYVIGWNVSTKLIINPIFNTCASIFHFLLDWLIFGNVVMDAIYKRKIYIYILNNVIEWNVLAKLIINPNFNTCA
jgi:hypothetical protein